MIEGQEDVSWDDWRALAAGCEQHGIDTLYRSDHYLSVSGFPERGSLDAWATLAGLAAVTETLRLGTLVSPATFRHPSVLAKSVVTVDHISGGRAELGLGTGWLEAEHRAYGFPFPPLRERFDRFEEQLEIITREWGEGGVDFDSAHYSIERLDALPKPIQRPRPPLLLGGRGAPRSVALAARYADEYNTVHKTLEELREIRAALDAACEAQGRREPLPLSLMTTWIVADERDELADRADRLAAWMGREGGGEQLLRDADASWIVGTTEEAREQLDRLAEAGVERVMAQQLLHRDLDALGPIGRLSD